MNPLYRRTAAHTTTRLALGLALGAMFGLASAQVNVKGDTGMDTSGNYQQERAWCLANTAGEAQVDCLKGSGNALAEKRRGTLDNNGGTFRANAMERCDVFTGEELAACKVRVMGYTGISGSVEGGGIIKQSETVVVPSGQNSVIVEPKTPNLILVVPGDRR